MPHNKTTLLVGFDSAWTQSRRGAIVGLVRTDDGLCRELGLPALVNFTEAETVISEWQRRELAAATIIMIDQPIIVTNAWGQRPVENVVSSPVGLRYGGVQPASTKRRQMFGPKAPVMHFLEKFGGAADPL